MHRCRRSIRPRWTATALLPLLVGIAWACAPAQDPQPLRVMTFNIAAGHGDLEQIASAIRTAAPDIVALQELDLGRRRSRSCEP